MSDPASSTIPVPDPAPFLTFNPVVLAVPGRPVPLEVKISMPADGIDLPLILLSHGHGETDFLSSSRGYSPLAEFWAARGFVVLQPTHLDSKVLGLRESDLPDAPTFFHDRATDMHVLLDRLAEIEEMVPTLRGRIDHGKVMAVGHSAGGGTVGFLMGAQVLDPDDPRDKNLADERLTAGVLIAAPGIADPETSSAAAERSRALRYTNFENMTGTALVIAGDRDLNLDFSTRLTYRQDAYRCSPSGNKTLAVISGAEHIFGGISGWDSSETTDTDPSRVAGVAALVWAYCRTQLYPDDSAWSSAREALETRSSSFAQVETR